jgi:hypothetical protein
MCEGFRERKFKIDCNVGTVEVSDIFMRRPIPQFKVMCMDILKIKKFWQLQSESINYRLNNTIFKYINH